MTIADLAGDAWPRRAREAACLLSGEGHDTPSINVQLLADIQHAFGDEPALRSVDLVARLNADPERPWVEWQNSKPLTPKQLGGLLAPFGITSETVSIADLKDAKGYKRVRFEELWSVYLPGQNTLSDRSAFCVTSKRRNADGAGVSHDFRSVAEDAGGGSKNSNLSHSHAGSDASTAKIPVNGCEGQFDQAKAGPSDDPGLGDDTFGVGSNTGSDDDEAGQAEFGSIPKGTRAQVEPPFDDIPACLRRCIQCGAPGDATSTVTEHDIGGERLWLHQQCADLRRHLPEPFPEPRKDGRWAGSYLSDDDIKDIEADRAFK